MSLEPWQTLDERVAFENDYARVRLQRVALPDGERYEYTVVDRPTQGVATFLFDASGRLLLEREYRHGVQQVVWQLPGGLIDEGESALASARRELKEETGYEAEQWEHLGGFYDNPALGNAHSTLFVARHPRRAGHARDAAEWVELEWVTMGWLRRAIADGEIVERVILSGMAMLWARGVPELTRMSEDSAA